MAAFSPHRVYCAECGMVRTPEVADAAPRPPCPECGKDALRWEVRLSDEIRVEDSVEVALTPGDSSRSWRRRWEELQRDLDQLNAPHAEQMSGAAIHAAHQQLQSFYIQTYHMKDALKAEAPALGLQPKMIETAIYDDSDLALLADLANLDKHYKLSKVPRSGAAPVVGDARGSQAGSSGGWRMEVDIRHSGKRLDGLKVANAAAEAWRRHLQQWGLI